MPITTESPPAGANARRAREDARCALAPIPNLEIARALDEAADLLAAQDDNPYRVQAYRNAARTLRRLPHPAADLLARGGTDALEALPTIGPRLARSIAEFCATGRLPVLERLRGAADPEAIFRTLPGIGPMLARRLHEELHLDSLEALEVAAHDGRLATLPGFGPRRLASLADTLAARLGRRRRPPAPDAPPVAEILSVDHEYRAGAAAGTLPTIAPRRFNPSGEAWLPVLHTRRGARDYTALFSNTAHAHARGMTRDWVVVYAEGPGAGAGHQWTVITSRFGDLAGRRIVRGREDECRSHDAAKAVPIPR